MNQPTAYLAGPITGMTFENATDWREHTKKRLADVGITGFSPLRAKQYIGELGGRVRDQYDTFPLSTASGIICRDRYDATHRDIVLVNMLGAEKVSIGTVMEIAWADAFRVPIVLVMEEGNIHTHAMLTEVSSYIVPTLDEGIDIVIRFLLP